MMVELKWTRSLSVNHPTIDDQHRNLFRVINKLVAARKAEDKNRIALDVLKELIDYTRTHFADEQRHMYAMTYPRIEQHMNEHTAFINKLEGFLTDYETGVISLTEDILKFLASWWLKHVSESDMGYAGYIPPRG